jgi:TRAP-type C4-dicarboxylate transport system permease large subunit
MSSISNSIKDSFNRIKWLIGHRHTWRKLTALCANLLGAFVMVGLSQAQAAVFAQTIDTSKIKAASQAIISSIQAISSIGVTLLLVIGLGLLMWAGALDAARIKALRIIGWAILGGALLFLFAQPLGDFLTGTFGAKA